MACNFSISSRPQWRKKQTNFMWVLTYENFSYCFLFLSFLCSKMSRQISNLSFDLIGVEFLTGHKTNSSNNSSSFTLWNNWFLWQEVRKLQKRMGRSGHKGPGPWLRRLWKANLYFVGAVLFYSIKWRCIRGAVCFVFNIHWSRTQLSMPEMSVMFS